MISRSRLIAVPLAVLVAVLAHVAGFGTEHVAGGAYAGTLLTTLGAALGAAFAAGFLDAAIRPGIRIATWSRDRYLAHTLLGGGLLAYTAIEVLEGHANLGGSLRASLALVPSAAIVAWIARFAADLCNRAGTALAALDAVIRALGRLIAPPPRLVPVRVPTQPVYGRRRGRAPPTRP